jgi:acyl carrier protein
MISSISAITSIAPGTTALDLLRQVLVHFSDALPEQVVPEAELSALQVDSLTLAEMLFELEDCIGVTLDEPAERPQTVADILQLIEPHLALLQRQAA